MCESGNNTDTMGCEKLSSLAGSVLSEGCFLLLEQDKVTTVTNHTKPRGFFPLQAEVGAGPTGGRRTLHSGCQPAALCQLPSPGQIKVGKTSGGKMKTVRAQT